MRGRRLLALGLGLGALAACAPPEADRAASEAPGYTDPGSPPPDAAGRRAGPPTGPNDTAEAPTAEEIERYLDWLSDDEAGAAAADPEHDKIWRPAETPPGGVSWALLESTEELTRVGDDGYIRSRPVFPPAVEALDGQQITVAGWMMPLETGARQRRFVLLAYPPGCPFHMHALPFQFIEVLASEPVRLDEANVTVVTGVLELTGGDESGIFYRLHRARRV